MGTKRGGIADPPLILVSLFPTLRVFLACSFQITGAVFDAHARCAAALRIQERLRFAATVCSLIASLGCNHQANSQILPLRTFTIDDGLPSNQIRALCQDRRGYLWIGTYGGGVSMFDGTTFRSYTTLDGLPSAIVWSLTASRFEEDVVWLGTWGGLCRPY